MFPKYISHIAAGYRYITLESVYELNCVGLKKCQISILNISAADNSRHRVVVFNVADACTSVIHCHSRVHVHEYFAFSQLQCQLVQCSVNSMSSLSEFDVVKCLSQ